MSGVEILATEEVGINLVFNWTAFWIVASILFGASLIIGTTLSIVDHDWSGLAIGVVLGMIFGSIFGCFVGVGQQKPTEFETHYKVTISDEVSMNEFTEKYEIIDQDEKIYTIREKNLK